MIIDKIQTYLADNCPYTHGHRLTINCLGTKPRCFSIEPAECEEELQKYPDGGSLRQSIVVLAMRVSYDSDPTEQQTAAVMCEQIASWIDEQNERGNLPRLGHGYDAVELKAKTSGILKRTDQPTARYEIKIRLIYEKI